MTSQTLNNLIKSGFGASLGGMAFNTICAINSVGNVTDIKYGNLAIGSIIIGTLYGMISALFHSDRQTPTMVYSIASGFIAVGCALLVTVLFLAELGGPRLIFSIGGASILIFYSAFIGLCGYLTSYIRLN